MGKWNSPNLSETQGFECLGNSNWTICFVPDDDVTAVSEAIGPGGRGEGSGQHLDGGHSPRRRSHRELGVA